MIPFEECQKLALGKTLTNLYFTKQDGPHDYLPGIFPAYYFSTIMELDNEKKYRFVNDGMIEWNEEEPLIKLTNENWQLPKKLIFKNQKIGAITTDEYEQLTFHLENGTTIAHTIDYGDKLLIKNESSSPNRELKVRKWWQKLFGSE